MRPLRIGTLRNSYPVLDKEEPKHESPHPGESTDYRIARNLPMRENVVCPQFTIYRGLGHAALESGGERRGFLDVHVCLVARRGSYSTRLHT